MSGKTAARPKQYLRTDRRYNLHLVSKFHCDENEMPEIAPVDEVPDNLVGWSESSRSPGESEAVHFFTDDYRFEAVWNAPERYVDRLRAYGMALTPDFSLYSDMPLPMQIWNVYRSRAVGSYWQRMGITVIPTLQWSTPDSYVFALEGIPEGAVVAVSTVGVIRNVEATDLWVNGMRAAMEKIRPSAVLHFGDRIEGFDWTGTELYEYEHGMARRFEDGRKRRVERDR